MSRLSHALSLQLQICLGLLHSIHISHVSQTRAARAEWESTGASAVPRTNAPPDANAAPRRRAPRVGSLAQVGLAGGPLALQ